MDTLNELYQFYEKITKYNILVRDFIDALLPSNTMRRNMQKLRTELQRSYSRLESEITQYSEESLIIVDPIFGHERNVFEVAFDTIDLLHFVENLRAINMTLKIVNKAIGKLEKERGSWGVEKNKVKHIEEPKKPKAFISHGKGEGALLKLESFLIELGVQPIIVKNQPNLDRTIDKKVEDCLNEADFVVILATGDDKVGSKFQPRPNVIHEIGLAQQTHRGKIIYLLEEGTEFPSNIRPKVYEPFARQSMDRAFTAIVREIKKLGFL